MDQKIKSFRATPDEDLQLCLADGVAYQSDMTHRATDYGVDYLTKCEAYKGNAIATAVNAARCDLLGLYVKSPSWVLDVGCATGEFMDAAEARGYRVRGFDVIPEVSARLRRADKFGFDPEGYAALTFWDSLEHDPEPARFISRVSVGAHVFVSLPIFTDLRAIRQSKHYRPGEHLYYWTADGLIKWFSHYGYKLRQRSDHEAKAGRDAIGAFVFLRDERGET